MDMNRKKWFFMGAAVGAAGMYYLDPNRAKQRRAFLRDRVNHWVHRSLGAASVTGKDLTHRAQGSFFKVRSLLSKERNVNDRVIEARVRAKLGRVVSHPHAIEARSINGKVTLSGLVLAHEIRSMLSASARVRGVKSVDHQLEIHEQSNSIPSLQGGKPKRGIRIDLLQTHWSPATRFWVGLAGLATGVYGASRRDTVGGITMGFSALALARSFTNLEIRRLLGIGARQEGIDLHKTIHVDAPVGDVYQFWADFTNFPWKSEVTRSIPNELLTWKGVGRSLVRTAGQAKFLPGQHGGTKIEFDFSYNPPAGVLGDLVAKFLGAGPKKKIEKSIVQMRRLIEQGPSRRQQARALSGTHG